MPRQTPEQLAEARRRKKEEEERRRVEEEERLRAEKQRRLEERAAREAAIAPLRERLAYLQEQHHRRSQLKSVLEGLYVEMDKLARKKPNDEITELALKRVNDVIQKCKDFMKGDEFIDSIDPFVPAGERPEHRDVVLVLSELKQGIKRLEEEYNTLANRICLEDERAKDGDEKKENPFGKAFTF